jgi:uncharacterized phage protein gp47/JayE
MGGLTVTGLDLETFDDLTTTINQELQAAFGQSFDVSPDSPEGQIVAIFAERLSLLWELAEAIYASQDPDVAEGVSLDALGALTGALRLEALQSTSLLVFVGTNATLVLLGTVLSVTDTGLRFALDANATIVTLTAWAITTAYVVGDLRQNVGNIYSCTIAGTSAGAGPGPTGTGTAIVDVTVTWRFVAVGTAAVASAVTAELFGPTIAAAGTLTVIETPIGGLTSVSNPLDALIGRDEETDPDYRLRRELLLRNTGKATLEAIRAGVLTVAGVIECVVFENITLTTDVDGVPGKAFEVVVSGGLDQDIREAVWNLKPVGIESHGTVSGTITDSQGFLHTIEFSRPTVVDIHVRYDVTIDALAFPVDGVAQIKQACVDYGDALSIGEDVIFSGVSCVPFHIPGVLDVVLTRTGTSGPPLGIINIVIATRQKADFDTSRVTVNLV